MTLWKSLHKYDALCAMKMELSVLPTWPSLTPRLYRRPYCLIYCQQAQ